MTPLMRQYWDIKSLHQDKILFFRMGDFFEMFFEDAVTAAPLLGIALTQRNKKSNDETPMCGMPHHSIAGPINKLLKSGYKVAICDQVEDPKLAKGIVKRAVTRILTPGMVYDPDSLDHTQSSYMASIEALGTAFELSLIDTTTGELLVYPDLQESDLYRLLEVLPIAEYVLPEKMEVLPSGAIQSVHKEVAADSYPSTGRLKSYIQFLGRADFLKTLRPAEIKKIQHRLDLNLSTVRHLELFETYKGEGAGSLYNAINRTKTSSGARLLRSWINFPLVDIDAIRSRQRQVSFWRKDPAKLKKMRELLSRMGDIERRLSRLTLSQCNARDLKALVESAQAGIHVLEFSESSFLKNVEKKFLDLLSKVSVSLEEEPPLAVKQGHMIKKGVHATLDEWIELSTNSHKLILELENRERAAIGISSLKIRYNNVFGYYIEVTNTHKGKVPSHYMRKQTLANAERYCTDELIEIEKKVLSAQAKRFELEYEIFEELRVSCIESSENFLRIAQICSELDVICSMAWLSIEKNYSLPDFSSGDLHIEASRHPVVEQTVNGTFVANDIVINQSGCILLTGPNMAGKSTLMRQVALTVILAQMGSYVPASRAKLPVFDHIFTRIGASDQLSEGLSTFMVEMTETAEMLKRATPRSLLILDEIGRGTSTFDGMTLARAILEFLLSKVQAMTLFATHYHELTALSEIFPQLKNAHMSVVEKSGNIRFLHSLKAGPALKSYGIQVARLAGLPDEITHRAQVLLKELESKDPGNSQMSLLNFSEISGQSGLDLDPELLKIKEDLKNFPVSQKTPLEAMMLIAQWQKTLSSLN